MENKRELLKKVFAKESIVNNENIEVFANE